MKNADDSTPSKNILPDDSDLGPEPDWLLDDGTPPEQSEVQQPTSVSPPEPEIAVEQPSPKPVDESHEADFTTPLPASTPIEATNQTGEHKEHPWLWGAVPLVLLLATGLIAWFGSTQTLNHVATWDAISNQQPPLLPARWAMMTLWAVIPLLAVFLFYSILPAGRTVTRIKITGPLISVALAASGLWIFAQHWRWTGVGILSMGIAASAIFVTYLLVALGPTISNLRQRFLAVAPLSATLGFSMMLTVLSWQSYSSQPFGERGSSVLFALALAMIAAVFAFFLRDGLFALVLAIWFAGVVHQQWGEDALVSLIAAVATILTGALAGLGTILATESHRPSLTATVENRRGRTSFFRKKADSTPEQLP